MSGCGQLHERHWFTVYGAPRLRAPVCQRRCGAKNPRPLTEQEQREYVAYLVSVAEYRVEMYEAHSRH
jgi:hypothetical protein